MKNMKKVVLLIMLGLMVSFSVFAQQALKGTIRSKADKQPLPGVSVAIKDAHRRNQRLGWKFLY